MSRNAILLFSLAILLFSSIALAANSSGAENPSEDSFWNLHFRNKIEKHLGRPYGWGARGPKRFDCSGFIWRIMRENGVRIKRTTARKLYFALPKVTETEQWQLGAVVFFDQYKHCGIVNDSDSFYHASSSQGTTLSRFDPYWREKISGFRKLPIKKKKPVHSGSTPSENKA